MKENLRRPRENLKHKIRPLVTPIEQTYESFVLRVLSELLVEGPSAPFYQALIESGLGQAFSPVTGKLFQIFVCNRGETIQF